MKYVANKTKSIRDGHTGKMDKVTKGEIVSATRAEKFGLENFAKASNGRKTERYSVAEADTLAKLYLELNGNVLRVVERFIAETDSPASRAGSVECMVRRIAGLDNTLQTDTGLPLESHKDFGKVYRALLTHSPSASRFL